MKNKVFILALTTIALAKMACAAPAALFFVDPPAGDYFSAPYGKGVLRICKNDDGPNVRLKIPAGTVFADKGPAKVEDAVKPPLWLLTLVITKKMTLKAGQKCGTTAASVTYTRSPPWHPEMKSLKRFGKDDNRTFEVIVPVDDNSPLPDLGPWNHRYPSLSATAETDFK